MQKRGTFFSGLLFITQVISGSLAAQSWDLVREQEGIKIYTRQEAGKPLKAYKGTAVIPAPAVKVFSLIEDVNHTGWWDPGLSQIKVLAYEKNRSAQYYLVFDSPWPVADRDLYVDVAVNADSQKGIFTVSAVPLTGAIPAQEDRVRIRDYRQTWTVTSAGENSANVVIEGYVDPAGNIPVWLSNMLTVESPLNAIKGIRRGLITVPPDLP